MPEGAIVAIVGANGAGKTTLIRAIAGMLRPARGRIRFRDADITGWPSYRICNLGIGQVAEGRQLFPTLTVAENLQMGAMVPRAYTHRARNYERALALFPILEERARQAAGTLSGGEQQMLAIARCLMGAPDLVMFDEPSLGLAPAIVHDVLKTIRELNREGLTCVLVEQNVAVSLKIATTPMCWRTAVPCCRAPATRCLPMTGCAKLTSGSKRPYVTRAGSLSFSALCHETPRS